MPPNPHRKARLRNPGNIPFRGVGQKTPIRYAVGKSVHGLLTQSDYDPLHEFIRKATGTAGSGNAAETEGNRLHALVSPNRRLLSYATPSKHSRRYTLSVAYSTVGAQHSLTLLRSHSIALLYFCCAFGSGATILRRSSDRIASSSFWMIFACVTPLPVGSNA